MSRSRETCTFEKRPTCVKRDLPTYQFVAGDNKYQFLRVYWQSNPGHVANISKETCKYIKRDLQIYQKRPVCLKIQGGDDL